MPNASNKPPVGPPLPGAYPGSNPGPWPGTIVPPSPPDQPYYQGARQYLGPRVVPKVASPAVWNDASIYEALTIVSYMNTSYISRRPVPAGVQPPNDEYWAVMTSNDAQYQALVERVESLEKTVAGDADSVEAQIAALKSAIANNMTDITDIKSKNTQQDTDIGALQTQTTVNAGNIAANANDITAIKSKNSAQDADITALKTDTATNASGIATNKSDIDALKPRVTALEGDSATLKTDVAALKTKDGQHDTDIAALQTAVAKAQSTADNNTAGLAAANTGIAKNASDISDLQSDLASLQSSGSGTAASVTALSNTVNAMSSDLTALSGRVSKCETDIAALQAKDTGHDTQISNIKADISSINTEINSLQTDLTNVKKDVAANATAISTMQGQISNLVTRVGTLETTTANLTTRVQNLELATADIQSEITAIKKSNEKHVVVFYDQFGDRPSSDTGVIANLTALQKYTSFNAIYTLNASFSGTTLLNAINSQAVNPFITDVVLLAGAVDARNSINSSEMRSGAKQVLNAAQAKYPNATIRCCFNAVGPYVTQLVQISADLSDIFSGPKTAFQPINAQLNYYTLVDSANWQFNAVGALQGAYAILEAVDNRTKLFFAPRSQVDVVLPNADIAALEPGEISTYASTPKSPFGLSCSNGIMNFWLQNCRITFSSTQPAGGSSINLGQFTGGAYTPMLYLPTIATINGEAYPAQINPYGDHIILFIGGGGKTIASSFTSVIINGGMTTIPLVS